MTEPLNTTAVVVGIITAAIGSVKFLYTTINNIKNVPTALENIKSDLRAIKSIFQNLIINLKRENFQMLLTNTIKSAVENCNSACSIFKKALDYWIKYAIKYKAFWAKWTNQIKINIFKQGIINVFKGRLNDCKNTLNMALSTSLV